MDVQESKLNNTVKELMANTLQEYLVLMEKTQTYVLTPQTRQIMWVATVKPSSSLPDVCSSGDYKRPREAPGSSEKSPCVRAGQTTVVPGSARSTGEVVAVHKALLLKHLDLPLTQVLYLT